MAENAQEAVRTGRQRLMELCSEEKNAIEGLCGRKSLHDVGHCDGAPWLDEQGADECKKT